MATKCIDISDNKKMGSTSPVAMFVFMAIYVILTLFMDLGFTYFICLAIALVFTQIFFQYKPRYISMTIKFLFKNDVLSPSFEDKIYLNDETLIPEIAAVMHPNEVLRKQKLNAMNQTSLSVKKQNYKKGPR